MKKLIAEQKSINAPRLGIKNAFDTALYQLPDGHYELVVFMKLQFFFKNNRPHTWKSHEEEQFMEEWQQSIHDFWGNRIIHELPSGKTVKLVFDFHIQNGGWMFDHWEITVTKIAAEDFKVSFVEPTWNNVHLDSEDLSYVGRQRGAIHEFGHMIGLGDEYNGKHIIDIRSVMHSGEETRDRHFAHFVDWVELKLAEAEGEPV